MFAEDGKQVFLGNKSEIEEEFLDAFATLFLQTSHLAEIVYADPAMFDQNVLKRFD
jgi:hypothetical protein